MKSTHLETKDKPKINKMRQNKNIMSQYLVVPQGLYQAEDAGGTPPETQLPESERVRYLQYCLL